MGYVAALNRFIAKSVERCLSFFEVRRGAANFELLEECKSAFEDLKKYLGKPSLLSKPVQGERLYLYLSTLPFVVCSVFGQERKDSKAHLLH